MSIVNVTSSHLTPRETAEDGFVQFFIGSEARSVTLEELWAIAHQQTRSTAQPAQDAFLSIGLRLDHAKKPWQYYCTPQNVKTFASTGKDGVHYSFLHSDFSDRALSDSPVVMTVPMNFENQNIMIAENLYEFLCLGARAGYGNLEAIANESLANVEESFKLLTSDGYLRSLSKKQKMLLQSLNNTFALSPLIDLRAHLRRLQFTYLDQIRMGEVIELST